MISSSGKLWSSIGEKGFAWQGKLCMLSIIKQALSKYGKYCLMLSSMMYLFDFHLHFRIHFCKIIKTCKTYTLLFQFLLVYFFLLLYIHLFIILFHRIIKVGKDLQDHQVQPSTQQHHAC